MGWTPYNLDGFQVDERSMIKRVIKLEFSDNHTPYYVIDDQKPQPTFY